MDARKNIDENKEENTNEELYATFLSTLEQIKEGDQRLRDEFISEYRPFILKVTSSALGRYVDTRNSDEYCIAMAAFNEAIDKFDLDRSYNFFLFSEQVIKRRLIDYFRKNKGDKEFPFSYFEDSNIYYDENLKSNSYVGFEDVEIKEEIENYKKKLKEFGITFVDLILNVPKHRDSRKMCVRIAKLLAEDEELYSALIRNKNIPRNALKKKAKVHGRTIGNNRKYIIALCLILKSNLELSKRYLEHTMEGGN